MYATLVESSSEYLEEVRSQKERESFSMRIGVVNERWEKVSSLAKQRRDNLSNVQRIVFHLNENLQCVNDVVKTGEKIISPSFNVGFDVEKGRSELKQTRVSFLTKNTHFHFYCSAGR